MMQKKNTIAEFISSEDADNFREEVQDIAGIKCYMATESFRLKEIAAVIYICSEKSYAEIFKELLKLQCSYMYKMTGEKFNNN